MTEKKRTPTADELSVRVRAMTLEIDRDALATRAADAGEEADLLPIAISSEFAVERYDWWNDERYLEILDHSPESVDLSRAQNGLPFLDSHNAMDGDAQMGRVLNVRLGSDGKLRGDVKFSRRQKAQDYRQDMLDGIRTEISVGYRIDPDNIERTKPKDGALTQVRIKRWTPYEASGVAVPADPTVGAGRSAREGVFSAPLPFLAAAPKAQERTVESNTAPAAPDNGAATSTTSIRVEDNTRADDILAIAGTHNEVVSLDEARAAIRGGKSAGDFAREVLDKVRAKAAANAEASATGKPVVELSDKERKEYSMARAILVGAALQEGERVGSFELEVSDSIRDSIKGVEKRGGIMVPTFTKQRAGLDSGTSTKGAELKFTQPGEFIDLLRNKMVLKSLGATMLTGLQGPIGFPNQNGAGTATWVGENPGSDVADSNLTLQTLTLSPKTLQSSTSYSRQLLAQSSYDVESIVRNDLALIHALAVDSAGFNGTGASNQPTGIRLTSGIGSVAMGTNGGTLTNAAMIDLETQVTAANADLAGLAYVTTPGMRGTLKKAASLSNTVGLPAWQNDGANPFDWAQQPGQGAFAAGVVNGYRAYATAQMPSTLTKGSSSGVCHSVLFGAWPQLVIGDWGVFELVVDPYRLKKQGMIEVTSFQMVGLLVRYAAAFAQIADALV